MNRVTTSRVFSPRAFASNAHSAHGDRSRALSARLLSWGLGLALSLLALAWIAQHVHVTDLIGAWNALSVTTLGPLLGALILSTAVRGKRLQIELAPRVSPAPSTLTCLSLMVLHNAALNVLPFRAGELGYPLLAKRWFGLDLALGIGSLVRMRIQDACIVACAVIAAWGPWSGPLRLAAMALVCGAAMALSLAIGRWRSTWPIAADWRTDGATWGLSLLNWAIKLSGIALALQGLHATTSFLAAWRGALGGEIAALLPLQGPASVGTYEAGVWFGTQLAVFGPAPDVPASHAVLAAAIAVHVVWLGTTLLAALMVLAWRQRRARAPLASHP